MRNGTAASHKTKETGIMAGVDLDGTRVAKIATGIGFFFRHMVNSSLATRASISTRIRAWAIIISITIARMRTQA